MSLTTVDDLAARLAEGHDDTVVCDVRFSLADALHGRREYEAAHIPTAIFVDLAAQLAARPGAQRTRGSGGGRHPLPPVAGFTATLGALGIGADDLVVAYDSAGGASAARLWWMLRSIGHRRVAVLDGGWPAWVAAGHPVRTGTETRPPVGYPSAPAWTGVVDAAQVAQAVAEGDTLIDSRAPERFRGEVEPIDARAGHIPGAINRFHADNLGVDGLHRSPEELAERFAGLDESPIVYCGSGVTACHNLLAMSLAGMPNGRLYPGSWSDWSSDPERPVAIG